MIPPVICYTHFVWVTRKCGEFVLCCGVVWRLLWDRECISVLAWQVGRFDFHYGCPPALYPGQVNGPAGETRVESSPAGIFSGPGFVALLAWIVVWPFLLSTFHSSSDMPSHHHIRFFGW